MAKQSPAQRLFTLTCCLLAAPRLGLSKQEIFESVQAYVDSSSEAREKMFERDKTSLRQMGVALEVLELEGLEEQSAHRYIISKGAFDWPKDLNLRQEHFQLLELAARAWNNRVMAPFAQSGLTRLKTLGLVPASRELAVFTPRLIAKHQSFDPVASAISEAQRVSFVYRKADSEPTQRDLDPQKLRFIEGQWVLLAYEGEELKNFLLRRIVSTVKNLNEPARVADAQELVRAEADLEALIRSQSAELLLKPESEAWWHFGAPEDNRAKVPFMDLALLAEDLMEFGGDLEVLQPQALSDRMRKGLERVALDHA